MNYQSFKQLPKKKLLLTKEGLDNLRRKLDELRVRRHTAVNELKLIDDSGTDEFTMTTQIQKLENTEMEAEVLNTLLQRVEPIVKKESPKKVSLGCTVGLKSINGLVLYTIVCSLEIDTESNKISEDSTLGRAVLNKEVGNSFSIVTPKGVTISYEVVSIS